MPASSKSQQRLMGWVHACKKGTAKSCPANIEKIAKGIKAKDAKDFAKTKHKGLPEVKENTKLTLIDFLTEFDRSDISLQQQHGGMPATGRQQQQRSAQQGQSQNSFSDKMAESPDRGDIIVVKANRYIVVGGSREGVIVKPLDGQDTTTIPHGTKFKNVGADRESGKTIFKAIVQ